MITAVSLILSGAEEGMSEGRYSGSKPECPIESEGKGVSSPFGFAAFDEAAYQRDSMDQTIIRCTECERVYTVRKRDDGTFLLTTDDGDCVCGDGVFLELGKVAETGSDANSSSDSSTAQ